MQLLLVLAIAFTQATAPLAITRVAPSAEVPAAEPTAVDERVTRARERFDAGDFDGAIADFEQAYTMNADASYIYNIGRIHEEAGRIEAAIASYRRFIRAPGVALDQRTQALERIEVLERIRDASREPSRDPEPVPQPRETTPADRIQPTDTARQPGGTEAGRTAIRTGIGLLGSGAGVAVIGFVLGGLALRDNRSLDGTEDPERRQDLSDRGRAEALAGDILIGTGAAIAVAGVVVLAVGLTNRRRAQRRDDTARVRLDRGLVLRF